MTHSDPDSAAAPPAGPVTHDPHPPHRQPDQHDQHDQHDALQRIYTLLRERTGHDFRHDKPQTILRRLDRRLQVHRPGETSHARRYPLDAWTMPWLDDGATWVVNDVDTDTILPDGQRRPTATTASARRSSSRSSRAAGWRRRS